MTTPSTTPVEAPPKSKRQRILKRRQALWNIRSSRDTEYKDVIQFMIPRLGRFNRENETQNSAIYSRYRNILDSSGGVAHRTLASGLMAGVSSPARPWLRLTIPDKSLQDYQPVKLWLKAVTDLMLMVFAKSNTYGSLHSIYEELGAFGTALDIINPDYEDVIRHQPRTIGEYTLALDDRQAVSTFLCEMNMTVEQVMERFAKDDNGGFTNRANISPTVCNAYDRGDYDTQIPVIHFVEPRKSRDREYGRRDNLNMPYASYYLEANGGGVDKVLSESGYQRFPALAPRWSVTSSDTWGWGPAMEAMGDIKQLQQEQLRKSQGIDYQTEPPIGVPAALKGSGIDRLPGGVTYMAGTDGVKTMFETKLDLQHLLLDIQDVRQRIDTSFFVPLFMMLANDTRSGITAREVAERHEEKLLQLGPVLERLHGEVLGPLVDITFERLVNTGVLPEPPKEMEGQELNIEFISILAQAQRAVGVGSVDRLLGMIGAVAQIKPDVLDKLDADQTVDIYADLLGTDPSMIIADENVAIIREQRAKQQQAMQQAQMATQAAASAGQAAKDFSAVDLDANTPAANAINSFSQRFNGGPSA